MTKTATIARQRPVPLIAGVAVLLAAGLVLLFAPRASAQEPGFNPEPTGDGVHLAEFDGGSIDDAIAAAPDAISFWVTVEGRFAGFIVGAPEFVNEDFLEQFPGAEIPAGTLMIVTIQGADPAVCQHDGPYVGDGTIPVDLPATPGNAHEVSDLRWAAHEGCERFVIDFVDEDGSLANAPGQVEAEVIRELGVVRIHLPDVEWVDFDHTDASFDGPLASEAYVVRSPDGPWHYVDLHLGDEAEAAVTVTDDPGRVVVDLIPGGGPIPEAAATDNLVVLLEPRSGDADYPLSVFGYARTFEANVVVRIEQDGEEVFEDFTTATAWTDAWGYYEFLIEDGPSGDIELHVGEYSAKDGTWEGTSVELTMP